MSAKSKHTAVSASASDSRIGVQTVASRTAKSGQPHPTVEHILSCAKQVLVKHGHAGFTTRLVAQAAAISPGNLSYHFPSKSELLQAIISQLVADYSRQFQVFLSDFQIPWGQELEALVRWLLTDAIAEETVRTFRELWAMSMHDEAIRQSVDALYDDLMEGVVKLIQRSHPNANLTSIRELVQVLALISEGSIVLYGTGRKRAVPHKRITELVTPLLGNIAPGVQISGTPKTKSLGKRFAFRH